MQLAFGAWDEVWWEEKDPALHLDVTRRDCRDDQTYRKRLSGIVHSIKQQHQKRLKRVGLVRVRVKKPRDGCRMARGHRHRDTIGSRSVLVVADAARLSKQVLRVALCAPNDGSLVDQQVRPVFACFVWAYEIMNPSIPVSPLLDRYQGGSGLHAFFFFLFLPSFLLEHIHKFWRRFRTQNLF